MFSTDLGEAPREDELEGYEKEQLRQMEHAAADRNRFILSKQARKDVKKNFKIIYYGGKPKGVIMIPPPKRHPTGKSQVCQIIIQFIMLATTSISNQSRKCNKRNA
jgi:hypothetical protein